MNEDRDAQIISLREEGFTNTWIGKKFSISRERARQILEKHRGRVDPDIVSVHIASNLTGLGESAIRQIVKSNPSIRLISGKIRLSSIRRASAEYMRRCKTCGKDIFYPKKNFCSERCYRESCKYKYWSEEAKKAQRERVISWNKRNVEKAAEIKRRAQKKYRSTDKYRAYRRKCYARRRMCEQQNMQ